MTHGTTHGNAPSGGRGMDAVTGRRSPTDEPGPVHALACGHCFCRGYRLGSRSPVASPCDARNPGTGEPTRDRGRAAPGRAVGSSATPAAHPRSSCRSPGGAVGNLWRRSLVLEDYPSALVGDSRLSRRAEVEGPMRVTGWNPRRGALAVSANPRNKSYWPHFCACLFLGWPPLSMPFGCAVASSCGSFATDDSRPVAH